MNKLKIPLFITLLGLQSLLTLKASYISELGVLEGSEAHKIFVRSKDLKLSQKNTVKNLKLKLDLSEVEDLNLEDKYSLELYYYDDEGNKILVNHINDIKIKNNKAYFPARIANLQESNYIFLDLRTESDELVSSYRAFIEREDEDGKLALKAIEDKNILSTADCDDLNFGECQLEYILKNLSFKTYNSKTGETLVSKKASGKYSVYIPVKKVKYRARRNRR